MARERRASPKTTEEKTKEAVEELEQPKEATTTTERAMKFRTPGWHRLRTTWNAEDAMILTQAQEEVEKRIVQAFPDAYQMMNEIYDTVREPMVDTNGEPMRDANGWVIWRRNELGDYEEDFTKLTGDQVKNFMFKLTTRLFAWQQSAANAWGEAMFAKAMFEERFAIDYRAARTGTIEDREAKGNVGAADEKYFALYLSLYSKKADGIVRTMERIDQRLKDVYGQ